jgi:DNA repair exonuclease SbcCD ATPase subunit
MNKETLEEKITELKDRIEELKTELDNLQIDHTSLADDDEYSKWIDDLYMPYSIGYLTFEASHVLRELDPVAYNCGFSDYIDSLDISDSEEYKELESELEDLESELEDLESELEDLETED